MTIYKRRSAAAFGWFVFLFYFQPHFCLHERTFTATLFRIVLARQPVDFANEIGEDGVDVGIRLRRRLDEFAFVFVGK